MTGSWSEQLTGQGWQKTPGSRHLRGSPGDAVKADPSLEWPDASPRRGHRELYIVLGAKAGPAQDLSGRDFSGLSRTTRRKRRRLRKRGGRPGPGAL